EASCVASEKVSDAYTIIDANQGIPAMITELRHDRLFLHCFQIAPEDELKVRVRTVVPLFPDGLTTASLVLPRFVATNFDLSGEENSLRLRSAKHLRGSLPNFKQGRNMKGDQLLSGTFAENQLDSSDLTVVADRTPATEAMIALDEVATENAGAPQY